MLFPSCFLGLAGSCRSVSQAFLHSETFHSFYSVHPIPPLSQNFLVSLNLKKKSPSVFTKHFKNEIYFKWCLLYVDFLNLWFLKSAFIYYHFVQKSMLEIFVSYLYHRRCIRFFLNLNFNSVFQLMKIWKYLPSQKPTNCNLLHFSPTLENFMSYGIVQMFELITLWMFKKFWSFGVSLVS